MGERLQGKGEFNVNTEDRARLTNAERAKRKRDRAAARREIAPMLVRMSRLRSVDIDNREAVDEAMLQLAIDWARALDDTCVGRDLIPLGGVDFMRGK